jgi:hypothetical protein
VAQREGCSQTDSDAVPNEAVPFEKQTEAVPDVAESESPIEETALADKQVNWSSNVVTPYSGVAIGAEQKVFLGRIGPTRERERERECVCVCVCSLYRPSLLYLPRSYLFPSRASPNFITYSNQITKGVQQGPKPRFERENRTQTTTPDEISAHRASDPSRKQFKTLKRQSCPTSMEYYAYYKANTGVAWQ